MYSPSKLAVFTIYVMILLYGCGSESSENIEIGKKCDKVCWTSDGKLYTACYKNTVVGCYPCGWSDPSCNPSLSCSGEDDCDACKSEELSCDDHIWTIGDNCAAGEQCIEYDDISGCGKAYCKE